ncbi:FtsX-like permease family protein [Convivina praedatoris]|uniref:FtsX-like permease family protein n=1 Tax=Convivina praedatoris TaxID=2880963 RepID=UPI0020101400|nr:ABC transporter permease [Convivina sp. LMG 32447]CAH1851938.1 ABC transporter permease protein YxdM [Convivina sp. LMG 32447]
MVELKLAWHSLTRNWQRYTLFVLSSTLLVAINYIFVSILQNPSIKAPTNNGKMVISVVAIGFVFIALLSLIFMFYANGFLTRQRNQELGIYNILGMTHRELNVIVFFQNSMMYVVSLITGLLVGISFQELAFLVLRNLLDNDQIVGNTAFSSVLLIATFFLVINLLIYLRDIFKMRRLNPINLLKAARQAPKEPKARWIIGGLGIVILGTGYYLSVTTKPSLSAIILFMIAVVLVVIGTYFLFIAGSIVILKLLRQNKKFYYQPNHFISVSGMLFRMKQNGAGLASICLLCTSTLVVLTAVISLFAGSQKIMENFMPYDMFMTSSQPLNQTQQKHIKELATDNHLKISNQRQLTTSYSTPINIANEHQVKPEFKDISLKNLNLTATTVEQYNQWQGKHLSVADDELLVYSPKERLKTDILTINGITYHIKQISDFDMPDSYADSAPKMMYLFANNRETVEKLLAHDETNDAVPTGFNKNIFVFNVRGTLNQKLTFTKEVKKYLSNLEGNVDSKSEMAQAFKAIFGGLLFVGSLIGITLSIITALIIYYKQISEGLADRHNFETMQRVGLSYKETQKAIHSQMLMVFMLPIAGAVINLGFAYPALRSVFKGLGVWDQGIFASVALSVTVILFICYIIVYLLTTRVYHRIVNG